MMFVNLSATAAPWYSAAERECGVRKMWEDGRDFRMVNVENPTYFSIRDLPALYKDGVVNLYLLEGSSVSGRVVTINVKKALEL